MAAVTLRNFHHGDTEGSEKKQDSTAEDVEDAQRAQGGVFLLCVLRASAATSAFNLASLLRARRVSVVSNFTIRPIMIAEPLRRIS